MCIEFISQIEVVPKQGMVEKNPDGTRYFHTKDQTKINAQRLYCDWIQHRPALPLTGPLSAEFRFFYRRKKKRKHQIVNGAGDYFWLSEEKPDVDNLLKQACDVAEQCRFFTNDMQIVKKFGAKFGSEHGFTGVTVKIEQIEQGKHNGI